MNELQKPPSDSIDVQELISRIRVHFPVPIKKPPFSIVYPASLSGSERKDLLGLYERLPGVAPEDFEFVAEPLDFDPGIFIGYASCFLISRDGKTLGLDPLAMGLCSGSSGMVNSGCGSTILNLLFRNVMVVGDRLDQNAKYSLLALCTFDQFNCLVDYLKAYSDANEGSFSNCIQNLIELRKRSLQGDIS